jgi:hypothetical protein
MRSRIFLTCCVAVCFSVWLAPAIGFAQGDSNMIQPGTPEAAKVITELKHAHHRDRGNAESYTGGGDSDRGMFYQRKANETKALLDKLQQGQAVSKQDVHHALDNKHAVRYGN